MDSKAEYSALSSTVRSQKKTKTNKSQCPFNTVQVKIRDGSPEERREIVDTKTGIVTSVKRDVVIIVFTLLTWILTVLLLPSQILLANDILKLFHVI